MKTKKEIIFSPSYIPIITFIIFSFLSLLFCCFFAYAENEAKTDLDNKNVSNILQKQNNFALKFTSELVKAEVNERSERNIFISPFSLTMALNLVLNAVDGSTKNELFRVMNENQDSLEKINSANKLLLENLSSSTSSDNSNTDNNNNNGSVFTLEIANGLWVDMNFPVYPEYKNLVEKFYYAKSSMLDFSDPKAVEQINDWVSLKTHNKITKILSSEDLQRLVMLLANATYFKGQWESPFSKDSTDSNGLFYSWGENSRGNKVLMMKQRNDWSYWEDEKVQVVEMPYKKSSVSAYVILPRQKGYKAFVQEGKRIWTDKFWHQLSNQSESRTGILKMPKFKFEYKKILNDDLKNVGIKSIFSNNANFSKLTPKSVQVSFVLQKTFVNVDEYGTEAAAVTAVGIRYTSAPPTSPFVMNVNRPFYFIIRENNSGSFLFAGLIIKP
ncbi:MAG: serpin family protein [Oligoflexia bacterium]|nr:serpin family protein [Oligoflexia bacterium]